MVRSFPSWLLSLTHALQGPQPVAPAPPAHSTDVVFLTFTRFDLVSAFAYAYYPICRPILATWASIPSQDTAIQQRALTVAVPTEQVVDSVPIQRPILLLTWVPVSVDVDVSISVGDLEAAVVELDSASCDDGLSTIISERVEEEDSVSVHGLEAEAADAVTEVTVYGTFTSLSVSLSFLLINVFSLKALIASLRLPQHTPPTSSSSTSPPPTSSPPSHTHTIPSASPSSRPLHSSPIMRPSFSSATTTPSPSLFPASDPSTRFRRSGQRCSSRGSSLRLPSMTPLLLASWRQRLRSWTRPLRTTT